MNNSFERKSGIALIVFTILLMVTIGLHPVGGSVEHLLRVTNLIVITHAIAILSLPFGWIGFWGLTRRIGTDHFGSMPGLIMISLALIGAMFAAAINGLVLPIFLQSYKDASAETIASIKPILRYGFAVNHAFDYIYTVAFCLGIFCWSIAILQTRKLAIWIGWLGIIIALIVAAVTIAGVAMNSLHGLRIFIGSIVLWILVVGIWLYKKSRLA